jgi:hypothetical protein
MKTIINRLRWLSAGVYLGIAFIGWLEKDKNTKAVRKMADEYPVADITLLNGYPPEPTIYAKSFDDVYNHYKNKEQRNV